MAVSVVVGAQYGSEGKGKVAHFLAQEKGAAAAVRVGGPNSGHTVHKAGTPVALRQLPTAALLPDVLCILAPGSYIDPGLLQQEINATRIDPARVLVDPRATVITDVDRAEESGLNALIGSTETGVGAAVARRVRRSGGTVLARDCGALSNYLADSTELLRRLVTSGNRVVIEGTQGYGLSVLHSDDYPMATSRDTTAAGVLSEAGLSPMDVDEVVLVARSYPIRVAGNSGPLPAETTWEAVARAGSLTYDPSEYTTVTKRLRRVGRFDPGIVLRAMAANRPTHLVCNHVDLFGDVATVEGAERVSGFLAQAEGAIQRQFDYVGLSPSHLLPRSRIPQTADVSAQAMDRLLAAT